MDRSAACCRNDPPNQRFLQQLTPLLLSIESTWMA